MELTELLDEDMAVLLKERPYKESKQILQFAIKTMDQLALAFGEPLKFERDRLCADNLTNKIDVFLKNRKQLLTDKVQTTRRNNENHRLVNYMMKKDLIIKEIENFINYFNQLDIEARQIMYDSFFKNETSSKVERKVFLSGYQVRNIKYQATEHLVNGIMLNQLLNPERSELMSLGLFCLADPQDKEAM